MKLFTYFHPEIEAYITHQSSPGLPSSSLREELLKPAFAAQAIALLRQLRFLERVSTPTMLAYPFIFISTVLMEYATWRSIYVDYIQIVRRTAITNARNEGAVFVGEIRIEHTP